MKAIKELKQIYVSIISPVVGNKTNYSSQANYQHAYDGLATAAEDLIDPARFEMKNLLQILGGSESCSFLWMLT